MNTVNVTQPQHTSPELGDLYKRDADGEIHMLVSFYYQPSDNTQRWIMVNLAGGYYVYPTTDLEECRKGFTFLRRNATITVS